MSKFVAALEKYNNQMTEKLGMEVDADLLRAITRSLGPSIYLRDASMVSCSDSSELDRVRKNFLLKKLGLEDTEALDEAIKAVCTKFGPIRNKHRAVFYYLLVQHLGQEAFFEKKK